VARRMLVIGAHPADPIDLAGGTIALHVKKGWDVWCLSLSNGIFTHYLAPEGEEFDYEKAAGMKEKEFQEACMHLGADWKMCWDDDLCLEDDALDLILYVKPHVLITHHPNEYAHFDHAEAGRVVCRALKKAVRSPEINGHWYVPSVYFFGVQFRPESARMGATVQPPDVLVDIEEVVEQKARALALFKSQGHDYEKIRKRMESFEGEAGRADGLRYAEAFILYHPLKVTELPMNVDEGFYKVKNPGK